MGRLTNRRTYRRIDWLVDIGYGQQDLRQHFYETQVQVDIDLTQGSWKLSDLGPYKV